MSQFKKRERENWPFFCFFVQFGRPIDWMRPDYIGESGSSLLLSLLDQMLIFSGNTLTDTLRDNGLSAIWGSLSPAKLTNKMNHHRNCDMPLSKKKTSYVRYGSHYRILTLV